VDASLIGHRMARGGFGPISIGKDIGSTVSRVGFKCVYFIKQAKWSA